MSTSGNNPSIGIDLGTTYSCVAVWQHNHVEIIVNDQGNRTTPSFVVFNDTERLVGDAAKNQAAYNPINTIFERHEVVAGSGDKPKVIVTYKGEEEFSAEEISSMILAKMKGVAETFLGSAVEKAVITVPAHFNGSQRQSTKDAAKVAGLEVMCMVNEPTAAAIAYSLEKRCRLGEKKNVLVFDLGGGTFDVSLLTIDGHGHVQVKATGGDTHLGGGDFDNRMVDHFVREFKKKHKEDISNNVRALGRLRVQCERAKRIVSTAYQTTIDIDSLVNGIDFSSKFTRAKFEMVNMRTTHRSLGAEELLFLTSSGQAGLTDPVKWLIAVDFALTSWRPSQASRSEVKTFKDRNLIRAVASRSSQQSTVHGTCGNVFERCEYGKKKSIDEVVLVGGSTRIPKVQQLLQEFFNGKSLCQKMNPDEAVAHGAGILAANLSGIGDEAVLGMQLVDVTPLSLGVGIVGKTMSVLIPKYSPISIKKEDIFSTVYDYQTSARIPVYQDACGILSVSARETTTGINSAIKITDTGNLSKVEIDKMIKDAERHKFEDKEHMIRVIVYKTLEDRVYNLTAKLKDYNVRLSLIKMGTSVEDMIDLEHQIENVVEWLDDNPDAQKGKLDDKNAELYNICTHEKLSFAAKALLKTISGYE
uniref:Heat shock protein 70 n=1 Tax=Lactuca sativa TaxID=4236 RepID=A0A9R1VS15_LACSA|nr:hypothetical protein LSAT_V11C400210340 [Lactuca sativa]